MLRATFNAKSGVCSDELDTRHSGRFASEAVGAVLVGGSVRPNT
jgi:hypothetical protein